MQILKPLFKMIWSGTEKADNKRLAGQIRPTGVHQICDIAYIDDGERGHLLDVYYPENTEGKLPVIIDVHGGGWMYGYKELNKNYCFELAKRGFCVFSLSYRLAMDDAVLFIHQLQDLFAAYKYIGDHMDEYPADRDNVFLTGDSAGGQFVCVSAAVNLSEKLREEYSLPNNSLKFKCVGATSPVIDLVSPNIMMNANLTALLKRPYSSDPCYKLMKFSNIATEALPPFYIVTSAGDFVEKQGRALHSLLDTLGVENKFLDWQGKVNGKKLGHVFSVTDPFSGPGIKVIDEMTDFFKAHM